MRASNPTRWGQNPRIFGDFFAAAQRLMTWAVFFLVCLGIKIYRALTMEGQDPSRIPMNRVEPRSAHRILTNPPLLPVTLEVAHLSHGLLKLQTTNKANP